MRSLSEWCDISANLWCTAVFLMPVIKALERLRDPPVFNLTYHAVCFSLPQPVTDIKFANLLAKKSYLGFLAISLSGMESICISYIRGSVSIVVVVVEFWACVFGRVYTTQFLFIIFCVSTA